MISRMNGFETTALVLAAVVAIVYLGRRPI
jgi:hypothetical protein